MAGQEVNMAEKFSANVELLATTAVGAFDGKTARMDFVDAEKQSWEQLGGTSATEITEAFGTQTRKNLSHFRRSIFVKDFEVQLELDKRYELKSIADFRGPYVQRGVDAYKERFDIEAIVGNYGTAYTGKNGTTAVEFDYTNQTVPVGVGAASGFTTAGMTKEKLIQARSKLKKAGWNLKLPMYQPCVAMTQDELDNLLLLTETQSSDYGNIMSLMSGEITNWLGMEFIFTELIPYAATGLAGVNLDWAENAKGTQSAVDTDSTEVHACFAFVKENLGMGVQSGLTTKIDELIESRHNWGLSMYFSLDGVRRQEDGAVYIPCDTTPDAV
jgi:hypothetical protein